MNDREFANLPADIAKALADYDAKVADGTIVFDSEGFATHHPDPQGGWIHSNLSLHLSVLDVEVDTERHAS